MRKMLLPLIAALVVASPLMTPEVATAEDLIQIYDLAVQSDPKLREAEQNLFATKEKRPQAMALLLPNVNLQGTVNLNSLENRAAASGITSLLQSMSGGAGSGGGSLPNRSQTYVSQNGHAQLSQPIYNRSYWMTLKQTDSIIAGAEAQFLNSQIDLMQRTTEKYFGVLEAADNVTVQEAYVKANERQLEQTRQRFDVGLVAITDVNNSQAQYDISKANLIVAKRQLDDAWEALRVIVGPLSAPLARLGEKLPLAPPRPNNVDTWADTAQRNNLSIIAAHENAASAKTNIEIQKSAFYPKLDLNATYDINRSGYTYQNNDANIGVVGMTLTVPVFQGGGDLSRTRQAGYQFRAAQDQLDQTRRTVDQSVKDAFRGILSSIEDVKARLAAVISNRANLESTQAGLEVGTRTQVDLLNAQRQLFEAEGQYLASRYKYILNGVKLHAATSTLTRDILAKGNAWLNPNDKVLPPAY